jgi:hypothetical protein
MDQVSCIMGRTAASHVLGVVEAFGPRSCSVSAVKLFFIRVKLISLIIIDHFQTSSIFFWVDWLLGFILSSMIGNVLCCLCCVR